MKKIIFLKNYLFCLLSDGSSPKSYALSLALGSTLFLVLYFLLLAPVLNTIYENNLYPDSQLLPILWPGLLAGFPLLFPVLVHRLQKFGIPRPLGYALTGITLLPACIGSFYMILAERFIGNLFANNIRYGGPSHFYLTENIAFIDISYYGTLVALFILFIFLFLPAPTDHKNLQYTALARIPATRLPSFIRKHVASLTWLPTVLLVLLFLHMFNTVSRAYLMHYSQLSQAQASAIHTPFMLLKEQAIAEYYTDTQQAPPNFTALLENTENLESWQGPYFKPQEWQMLDPHGYISAYFPGAQLSLVTRGIRPDAGRFYACSVETDLNCEYWIRVAADISPLLNQHISTAYACDLPYNTGMKCQIFSTSEGILYRLGNKISLPNGWQPWHWQLLRDLADDY